MKKNPEVFIEHILECMELIQKYLKNATKAEFLDSKQLQDSVIRRIEIIGEAVKNIPAGLKVKYRGIPWKQMAGMRDILIHEYFGIDLELTWKVAVKDMPGIKNKISKIKKDLQKE